MSSVDLAEMLTGAAADSELLRLVTCGSVDDGKSTLIGRLLYDSKQVMADQLEHVEETSERRGDGYVNLALLTDGLRAEREQGITIDVAYRSFVTPTRRFQLADAPGHIQYTRNMVTGASTADVAVVLLDARKGVIEQTRRHTFISATLGIPHIVFAVNKMDLVDFDEARVPRDRSASCATLSEQLGVRDELAIPIAALPGDNVVEPSERMPWWDGGTFLERLETIEIAGRPRRVAPPLPRAVGRPADVGRAPRLPRLRGPGRGWRVARRRRGRRPPLGTPDDGGGGRDARRARSTSPCRASPSSSGSRRTSTSPAGDMLCDPADPPVAARELEAIVCWMSERAVQTGARLAVKQTTRWSRAILDEVTSVLDVEHVRAGAGATASG